MFDNIKNDLKREIIENTSYDNTALKFLESIGNQGFQAVLAYRICRWLNSKHIPIIGIIIQRITEISTGISMSPSAEIAEGLLIYHFGGIVIHRKAKIGKNCTIHQEVTIGNRLRNGGAPTIGDNVYIGSGAKILGEITIGNNCKIGANAVVLESIPDNSTAVGIPAKIKNA